MELGVVHPYVAWRDQKGGGATGGPDLPVLDCGTGNINVALMASVAL